MSNAMTVTDTLPAITREKILSLEQAVHGAIAAEQVHEVDCPLIHRFAHGVYARELFVPKGTLVVAKIHKHDHISLLMKGKVLVATEEGGVKMLEAPMTIEAAAGTKRVAYACEDVIWMTVHPNPTNSQDLEQLEAEIIAPTYEAFDACMAQFRIAMDRDDYCRAIAEWHYTEAQARSISENELDQMPMPDGCDQVKIAPSPIEGQGVFAVRGHRAGTVIAPARIGTKRTPVGRFTNHAMHFNASMAPREDGNIDLVASRDIQPGEEITVNYRQARIAAQFYITGGVSCPG